MFILFCISLSYSISLFFFFISREVWKPMQCYEKKTTWIFYLYVYSVPNFGFPTYLLSSLLYAYSVSYSYLPSLLINPFPFSMLTLFHIWLLYLPSLLFLFAYSVPYLVSLFIYSLLLSMLTLSHFWLSYLFSLLFLFSIFFLAQVFSPLQVHHVRIFCKWCVIAPGKARVNASK